MACSGKVAEKPVPPKLESPVAPEPEAAPMLADAAKDNRAAATPLREGRSLLAKTHRLEAVQAVPEKQEFSTEEMRSLPAAPVLAKCPPPSACSPATSGGAPAAASAEPVASAKKMAAPGAAQGYGMAPAAPASGNAAASALNEKLQLPADKGIPAVRSRVAMPKPGQGRRDALAAVNAAGKDAGDAAAGELRKTEMMEKAAPAAVAGALDAASIPAAAKNYTVQPGDTLFSIAKAFLGDATRWSEIVKLNPGLKPENLQPGQILILP
jgi:nucleoid-associated protein YgaU